MAWLIAFPGAPRVPPKRPRQLAEAGVPVVVHAGHAPVATAHTGPGPFAALLARHPGLTAIVAHLGAGLRAVPGLV